jgi:chaperone modulatory protein CbpM
VATEAGDAVWVTETQTFTLSEVLTLSGLAEDELRALVEFGVLRPADPQAAQWAFSGQCLLAMRRAARIRAGFELEPHGVALVMSLLEQIRALQGELQQLQARTAQAR